MRARQEPWKLTMSDYVDPTLPSGTSTLVEGHPVVHQDLTATSYRSESFDAVVHAEVLEHVPDWRALLKETARLVKPGGATVFTAPFRAHSETTLVRAVLDADGQTQHLLEPEIHGAPLTPEGVLVYQVPGWDLLEELRSAGFQEPQVGWLYDPDLGLTSSNSDYDNHLEPIAFRAICGSSKSRM